MQVNLLQVAHIGNYKSRVLCCLRSAEVVSAPHRLSEGVTYHEVMHTVRPPQQKPALPQCMRRQGQAPYPAPHDACLFFAPNRPVTSGSIMTNMEFPPGLSHAQLHVRFMVLQDSSRPHMAGSESDEYTKYESPCPSMIHTLPDAKFMVGPSRHQAKCEKVPVEIPRKCLCGC